MNETVYFYVPFAKKSVTTHGDLSLTLTGASWLTGWSPRPVRRASLKRHRHSEFELHIQSARFGGKGEMSTFCCCQDLFQFQRRDLLWFRLPGECRVHYSFLLGHKKMNTKLDSYFAVEKVKVAACNQTSLSK